MKKVSVIITTKNEEKNIGNCLSSIKNQSYENIEIIVVDNKSTDKTKEIARKFTKLVYSIEKEIDLKNVKNFRGAQLNFGVKLSKGDIIFFPDADMTFDKDLIKEAVSLMMEFDALYVPEKIIGKGFFGKVRDFERSFYNGTCIDAVRFVKKDLFLKVGGFDEKNIEFGPDDWDFTKMVKQKNSKMTITTNKIYHHEEGLNLKLYLNKKKNYTGTFEGYIKKWGKDEKDVKRQLGFYYRLFGVFVEDGKWKKLIIHPFLTLGIFYVKFQIGIIYLFS